MQMMAMPRCCAMGVIVDFGGAHAIYSTVEDDVRSLKSILRGTPYRLVTVNLNASQKPNYHKHLIAEGFKMVASDKAYGSGRMVYHYVWTKTKPKAKKKAVKLEAWEK